MIQYTTQRPFYAGMEEAVSRILALFASMIFFSIYILSKGVPLNLDWSPLMIHLGIFWFVYEIISYLLFLIFLQFSRNQSKNVNFEPKNLEESTQKNQFDIDNNSDEVNKIN